MKTNMLNLIVLCSCVAGISANAIAKSKSKVAVAAAVAAIPMSSEQKDLAEARKLFAEGKYEDAIAAYSRIPKGSDRWLDVVEEKGWAYFNMNDIDKALGQAKTLLAPPFLDIASSEDFLLQSLSQLKICDYVGILETHRLFKETQKNRILEIQSLAKTGMSPSFQKVIENIKSFPITADQVGVEVKHLPRLFYRDIQLQDAIASLKKNDPTAQDRVTKRMMKLAQDETNENFKILKKLNLVDVEVTQRVYVDQKIDKKSYSKGQFAQTTANELSFPDDGVPWVDEYDKYRVRVNSCPTNIRRKM